MENVEIKRLIDRIATPALGKRVASDDEILEIFVNWANDLGLSLYPAQEEAILEIIAGRHIILNTPTGSGKSLVAMAMHFRTICRGERCFYTSPIKALVSEKFFELCRALGPQHVGMMTGDASINRDAPIVCCTAEVLANIGLREGANANVHAVVMDEFHYYADRDRGMAWQIPLLTMPQSTYVLMSATLGDTSRFEREIPEFTGRPLTVVRGSVRPVPLEFSYIETPIHETIEWMVDRERAPIYVVNFTQRDCAEMAQDMTSMNLLSKEQRASLSAAIADFRFDSVYGKDVARFIKAGVGIHHAGLLPKYRLLIEKLAQEGRLKVIVGTDTLGVGVNVPIRTVLFTKLCKYDGDAVKILPVRDFKQIAGRAGRKGFDDRGWVACQAPEHVIENKRLEEKATAAGKKKFQRRSPPDRGYLPWDEKVFQRLIDGEPETLTSNFSLDHGVMLNMLSREYPQGKRGGGYRDLIDLIARCHERPATKSRLRKTAAHLFRALVSADLVDIVDDPKRRAKQVVVAEDLQDDFSIFHTLGLYLVDALELLHEEDDNYALDILSLVEAILEDPKPILEAQERKIRNEKFAELKASGAEYDERMNELDKITYPKPNAEFIYDTYNRFAQKHPWIGRENVRPKSIAREMYETFATFNSYIKDYGFARIEGVLLRHLNQVYKAMDQMVPEIYQDERVEDIIAWLRALIDRVDNSLVQEWEQMLHPPADLADVVAVDANKITDISADRKAFGARVRAEMHRLVQALARGEWEEAALGVAQDGDEPWPAEKFAAALAPFLEEHERLVFNHWARLPDKTLLREVEPHLWLVRQTLLDPQEENHWYIEAEVDLRDNAVPEGPLLQIVRIES
jgi:superfamily II RNA helicase